MNSKFKGSWLAMLTAFVSLMALNGDAFFDAMLSLPRLIEAYTAMLLLGTGSFALSIGFAGGVYAWIERWAPSNWQPGRPATSVKHSKARRNAGFFCAQPHHIVSLHPGHRGHNWGVRRAHAVFTNEILSGVLALDP